ncbi:DUF4302 domain-containing protein [Dysgonomonas reticulitermitis]
MKKFYYSIIVLVIMLLQACTNETELIFDESASARMANTLKEYEQLLVSSPNGWLVDYYPQASRDYGGYQLFFRFAEGKATVKSEVKSSLLTVDESTSSYSLGEDMGPTLNFDTYNETLNFFSDPALNVGGGAGFGYEGDYEFVFISGDASEIILRGKKTKNTIRLTPFPATTTWQEYCDGVQDIKDAFSAPSYSMTVNGKAVTSITKPSAAYNRFVISYEEDKEAVSSKMAYVVSPTGIRFYEPLTIDGVTMQEFTFNKTSEQMVSADGKVVISLVFSVEDIFVNSLSSSRWYLSSTKMGSGFSTSFATVKSQIASNIGEQLAYSWIGASISTSTPSFSFGSYDGSQVWYGSILFDVTEVEGQESQIEIVVKGTSEVNGSWYISNGAPALGTFINSLGGKYNVTTTDSPRNISSVTLADPANSNRWLTLTLDEVVFP